MNYVVPVSNQGQNAILLELEPEGETINIEPGETCQVEVGGDIQSIGLAIAVKGGYRSVLRNV